MATNDETQRHTQNALRKQADHLYEQFGTPLEAEYHGQFVAIAPDGRTLLGTSAHDAGRKARTAFGPGNFVFQLGPRVVGKWR